MEYTFSCLANCQIQTLMRIMDENRLPQDRQLAVIRDICKYVGKLPAGLNPGHVYSHVFELFIQRSGIKDPCRTIRKQQNQQGMAVKKVIEQLLDHSGSRILDTMKATSAGNLIDVSFGSRFNLEKEILDQVQKDFSVDDTELFFEQLEKAKEIVILADNAGEIIIDKLLIDEIQRWRATRGHNPVKVITFVKTMPLLNDALIEDAEFAGLHTIGEVYDTGCSYIGTPFEYVSDFTRGKLKAADMIIAKGLANYESLYDQEALQQKLFYLFKSKCGLISEKIDVPINSIVCMNGQNERNRTTSQEEK